MTDPEIITTACDEFEELLRSTPLPEPARLPPSISPWVAASLLQKAIRRGIGPLAMAASVALLTASPERLWKRLVVISIEDVGVGGIDVVYQTIAAASERSRLVKRHDAQHLAGLAAFRLAMSPKCRASDDLSVVVNEDAYWEPDRLELGAAPDADLYRVVLDDSSIHRRAIAALQLIARGGKRTYDDLFLALAEAGAPYTLSDVCRRAFALTREPITCLLAMLWPLFNGQPTSLVDDPLPHEMMVGGIPGWALDQFSREGLASLANFRRTDCSTTRWLGYHVPAIQRDKVLRHAVFRAESGLCINRVEWSLGSELRAAADFCTWPFPSQEAAKLLVLVRDDITVLNQARISTYER